MVYRSNKRIESRLKFFEEIITPENSGEPSAFGKAINQYTQYLTAEIGKSVSMSFRGALGGNAKQLNKDLEQAAINENPQLALMDFLPKSTLKNQRAMAGLGYLLQNMGKFTGNHGGNNGNAEYQGRKHKD